MEIENLVIKRNYYYLWLKTVEDIDLKNHCAKSLVGKYSKSINKYQKTYEHIQLDRRKIYYFCGVANYKDNIHLAFRFKKHNSINIDNDNFNICIKNAEQIFFSEKDIDEDLKESKIKKFSTCRNWQFANYIKNHYKLYLNDLAGEPDERKKG